MAVCCLPAVRQLIVFFVSRGEICRCALLDFSLDLSGSLDTRSVPAGESPPIAEAACRARSFLRIFPALNLFALSFSVLRARGTGPPARRRERST